MFHLLKKTIYIFPIAQTVAIAGASIMQTGSNNTSNYKVGHGLSIDILHNIRPICEELSKDSELEKRLYGKTQNANESFNGTLWERIPKNTLVTLPNLQFGVYDAVARFNIGMKASVLIYVKLHIIPGVYMKRGCKKINIKRLSIANSRTN